MIVIDSLGAAQRHGYGLFGWCDDCSAKNRKDTPPGRRVPAAFDIDLERLIAQRGANRWITNMGPVPCPRCASMRTELRVTAPEMGAGPRFR